MKFLKLLILINVLMFNVPTIMAAEADPQPGPTTGTVAETMIAGGYVYLRLEEQDTWIATGPLPLPLSVGDQIQYSGGAEMKDFYSKSLDRTFDSILFIQGVSRVGQDASGVQQTSAMQVQGNEGVPMPRPAPVEAPAAGEIKPLSEGKTIADILAESDQLNEQTVSLNAKVMKVSKNIMGKNWITLQDGTGTEPENKLLTTSTQEPSPGDMVIASGIVRTDIDIGSGYKYKVLMQEVTFSPGIE